MIFAWKRVCVLLHCAEQRGIERTHLDTCTCSHFRTVTLVSVALEVKGEEMGILYK